MACQHIDSVKHVIQFATATYKPLFTPLPPLLLALLHKRWHPMYAATGSQWARTYCLLQTENHPLPLWSWWPTQGGIKCLDTDSSSYWPLSVWEAHLIPCALPWTPKEDERIVRSCIITALVAQLTRACFCFSWRQWLSRGRGQSTSGSQHSAACTTIAFAQADCRC